MPVLYTYYDVVVSPKNKRKADGDRWVGGPRSLCDEVATCANKKEIERKLEAKKARKGP